MSHTEDEECNCTVTRPRVLNNERSSIKTESGYNQVEQQSIDDFSKPTPAFNNKIVDVNRPVAR